MGIMFAMVVTGMIIVIVVMIIMVMAFFLGFVVVVIMVIMVVVFFFDLVMIIMIVVIMIVVMVIMVMTIFFGLIMVMVMVVMILVIVMIIVRMCLKQRTLTEIQERYAVCFQQFGDSCVFRQCFNSVFQLRCQVMPDPKHHIGLLQGCGRGRPHAKLMW